MVERVVEAVHLWQLICMSYKDIRAKENAWKQLASQVVDKKHSLDIETFVLSILPFDLGWRVRECRGVHKEMEINQRQICEGSQKVKKHKSGDPSHISTWPLFEPLTFLQDSIRHRQ